MTMNAEMTWRKQKRQSRHLLLLKKETKLLKIELLEVDEGRDQTDL